MYKKILVAFDGSEFSKAALAEASNWTRRHGGELILVHAVYFDEEEFGIAPEQLEKRMEFGKKVCYQEKEKVLSEFGIKVESLVCQGEPQDVITDIAREKGVDLIATGTYGRRGLKRLLMGSVTSGVVVNAPCDVMVVGKPCSECIGKYSSILVPYDGSGFSKKALERACLLSKADGAEVTVLYVIPRYEEMVGFFRTGSMKESMSKEARKILDEAKNIAVSQGVAIGMTTQEGHAADKIAETAQALGSDLVVMGSYGWRGVDKAILGSTAERVIMNAACPVLVVR